MAGPALVDVLVMAAGAVGSRRLLGGVLAVHLVAGGAVHGLVAGGELGGVGSKFGRPGSGNLATRGLPCMGRPLLQSHTCGPVPRRRSHSLCGALRRVVLIAPMDDDRFQVAERKEVGYLEAEVDLAFSWRHDERRGRDLDSAKHKPDGEVGLVVVHALSVIDLFGDLAFLQRTCWITAISKIEYPVGPIETARREGCVMGFCISMEGGLGLPRRCPYLSRGFSARSMSSCREWMPSLR